MGEAAAIAAALLVGAMVAVGHMITVRSDDRKWAALARFEGRTVAVTAGVEYTKLVTGTLERRGAGRGVTVHAERPRYLPLGEIREVVDVETGERCRL